MKAVRFDSALHNRFAEMIIDAQKRVYPKIYLAGKAELESAARHAVNVKTSRGCNYFPEPIQSEFALAVIALAKKKVSPYAFVRICGATGPGNWHGKDTFGSGNAVFDHAGFPFIDIWDGGPTVYIADKCGKLKTIPYEVCR